LTRRETPGYHTGAPLADALRRPSAGVSVCEMMRFREPGAP